MGRSFGSTIPLRTCLANASVEAQKLMPGRRGSKTRGRKKDQLRMKNDGTGKGTLNRLQKPKDRKSARRALKRKGVRKDTGLQHVAEEPPLQEEEIEKRRCTITEIKSEQRDYRHPIKSQDKEIRGEDHPVHQGRSKNIVPPEQRREGLCRGGEPGTKTTKIRKGN